MKKQIPTELDAIAKTVLAYKPPEKVKATNKRAKRKEKRDAKKGNYIHEYRKAENK